MKRVFLLVCDSFGIGAMPDANAYGDEGSNTLGSVRNSPFFHCPTLEELGLFNIEGVPNGKGGQKIPSPVGAFGRLSERSVGKDTTTGHWEMAGLVSEKRMPTYPNGFPADVLERFEKETGRGVLCNKPYSGTEVIKAFGEEHLRTGKYIVYTSADSVFQIAAHENVVPLSELYDACKKARKILRGEHAVGRVIARPFAGAYPFYRTANRHDFSLEPPKKTVLDLLQKEGYDVIGVGKINDIFAGKGLTETYRSADNVEGMKITETLLRKNFIGLCFVNLVDFDMVYGHRNDIDGYAKALSTFDAWLQTFCERMQDDDLLIVTADHGCDPGFPTTDHTREYVPVLAYGAHVKGGTDLKTREGFSDIAATICAAFRIDRREIAGASFWEEIRQ